MQFKILRRFICKKYTGLKICNRSVRMTGADDYQTRSNLSPTLLRLRCMGEFDPWMDLQGGYKDIFYVA